MSGSFLRFFLNMYNAYAALYARQSVDRADSISIESQLEHCRYEARGAPCREYADRGYSGKDTNRPAFAAMLEDIRQKKIAKVIVYRLDRISRSILDFANMMDTFQKYGVEFVSSTERFDTSTPIGRAMLNICIVFAQLERETIQKRVADAYYSRCKRGFYMGGRIPYGFTRTDTVIDGRKTSMYAPLPEEAEQIRLIYSLYADPRNSLGDIVRHLNSHGIAHLRGGTWNTARISDILRNPVYAKADAEIYRFFKSQGTQIFSPASDFTGRSACYLYSGTAPPTAGGQALAGKELVLAPHEGLIPPDIWLKCRVRCLHNRQSARSGKAKNSWLSGKIKCGRCGYGLVIVKSETRWGRYFICAASLATKKAKCTGTGGTIYADVLEKYLTEAIRERLSEFKTLSGGGERPVDPRINEYKIRLAEIEKEIEDFLSKIRCAGDVLLAYINDRIKTLDDEKKRLLEEIQSLTRCPDAPSPGIIQDPAGKWDRVSFEDRQAVLDILVKLITAADGTIEIIWNF